MAEGAKKLTSTNWQIGNAKSRCGKEKYFTKIKEKQAKIPWVALKSEY